MTTTSDLLDTLINVDSTTRDAAIDTAQALLGTVDGDTGQKALATAIIAHKIILNKIRSGRTSTDGNQNIETLDMLITDEIRRMVTDPDDFQSNEVAFHYSTTTPKDDGNKWY